MNNHLLSLRDQAIPPFYQQQDRDYLEASILFNMAKGLPWNQACLALVNFLIRDMEAQIGGLALKNHKTRPLEIHSPSQLNVEDYQALFNHVLQNKKPLLIEDCTKDTRCQILNVEQQEVFSLIMIPIRQADQQLAGILFFQKELVDGNSFSVEDWKKAQQMALFFKDIFLQGTSFNTQPLPPPSSNFQPPQLHLNEFVGESENMHQAYGSIQKVAKRDTTTILYGETGTGKELAAIAVHRLSIRSEYPFIDVNCAAIPKDLVESELFGHEKGAFSGAISKKLGKFELAHKGTLFLDEIGDLPLDAQAKLLRVLEEKKVWRVGGQKAIPIDVRVLVATHKRLEDAVKEDRFREDLFYRLNVLAITLPALRDRGDDIDLLAQYFLNRLNSTNPGFHPSALKLLRDYHWPGNVRELQSYIERVVLNHSGKGPITGESLFFENSPFRRKAPAETTEIKTLDEGIKELVQKALIRNHYNKSRTANELGIMRQRLDRLMKKYNICLES